MEHPMDSTTPSASHCWLYAFFHEGKYYCFVGDGDGSNYQRNRVDIVQILQEGPALLDTLRTVFDFVEIGVSSCDDGRDSSAFVRDNPSPEWEKAFSKARLFFTQERFPAFWNLALIDLGCDGTLNPCSIDGNFDYMYAIDLDNGLFHEHGSFLQSEYLVVSHPILGLTIEKLEKLHNQIDVEGGFCSQSFPLPHDYKRAIIDDLSNQGYEFCSEVSKMYAPILWRVKEQATSRLCCVQIFLPSLFAQQFCTPLQERHMTVVEELLMASPNPHPHLVRVWKTMSVHGNPAVIIDAYDSDLQTAREKLSRQQMNHVIAQVVEGIIYLHHHGLVHHEIKPSNILVKYGEREDGGDSCGGIVEAVIHDFQSVAIPSARYQNQKELSWGPFSHPRETDGHHHSHDDRWHSSWAPVKKSFRFLRRDFRAANPWTIDCSSVAMMFLLNNIEIYQAYQESSVSDYRDHPEFSVFFNVVNLYQSQAKCAGDAIEELEATIRTLSSMNITVTESEE